MRRLTTIPLAEVVLDPRLRFRDRLHDLGGVSHRYAEAMVDADTTWGEFPPALVVELTAPHEYLAHEPGQFGRGETVKRVYPAGTHVLVGGFTRCAAAEIAKVENIRAEVEPGDWDHAERLAWSENARHGKPRSSEELGLVLASIHARPEYAELGERAVAEVAGCSRATVGRFRRALADRADPTDAGDSTEAPRPAKIDTGEFEAALRDRWQRPVPAHLRETFGCGPELERHAKGIRALVTAVARMKHGDDGTIQCRHPGLCLLDVKKLGAGLLSLADEIDARRPFLVCPQCDGHGCPRCSDRGWLPRGDADALTPMLERKARGHAAARAV